MKKIILSTALLCMFAACEKTQPEGPAERVGRKVDSAAYDLQDGTVRTTENAKEMGRDIKARMQGDTLEERRERERREAR